MNRTKKHSTALSYDDLEDLVESLSDRMGLIKNHSDPSDVSAHEAVARLRELKERLLLRQLYLLQTQVKSNKRT